MKEEWQIKQLKDVCTIKPSKAEVRCLPKSNSVSFVPMEDLGIDQKITTPKQEKILSEVINSYTYFAENDVIMAKITPCFENGKLGIAAELVNGKGFGSSEFLVFRPHSCLHTDWLYYFLSRQDFREEGSKHMTGAIGHKRLSKDFIEQYPIPIPSIYEQRRIADTLDKIFENISAVKANAEKNLRNARALFESQLNNIFQRQDVWVTKKLGDVCSFLNRGISPKYLDSGGVQVLNQKCIRDHIVNYELARRHDIQAKSVNKERFIRLGDVLVNSTGTGTLGRVAQIRDIPNEPTTVDSHITIVRPKPEIFHIEFFGYILIALEDAIKAAGEGCGGQTELSRSTLAEQFEVSFPTSKLIQERVAKKLDALGYNIRRLEFIYQKQLAAFAELKQSILTQAFSGNL